MSTYVLQIAQALDYAHKHHVIHRDIKPGNILLNARDEVVLSDFGIAILLSPQISLSLQNPAGTPSYMAPEQLQGQPCAASDQYALAVMVYEWLCGQLPFRGSSALEVVFQHASEPPPRLRGHLPEVPQAVEDVVLRALAKEPGQRFASVIDFATDLQHAFFATQPLNRSLESPSPFEQTRSLPRSTAGPDSVATDQDDDPTQLWGTRRKTFVQQAHIHQFEEHEPTPENPKEPPDKKPEPAPGIFSRSPGFDEPNLPASQDWKNRKRMLDRLRRSYPELLDQSLKGITRMELDLTERPSAVQNVTNLTLRSAAQKERPLPPGTSIIQVYDDVNGELLILGEPGAGKSTLLLHLARSLVKRAQNEKSALLPIILPISSWAVKRSTLEEWMSEQIAQTYNVPRTISEDWVAQEQILPLLDGLDEMDEAARPACISAINNYHDDHFVPLVVCSRRAEYEAIADKGRLSLQTAVLIRPLTSKQIDAILGAAGGALTALRTVIQTQPAWQELATTPLMLQILMETYQGTAVEAGANTKTTLEEQVWTAYVRRMVEYKGDQKRYPLKQTRSWLSWLAGQMRSHNQTIFYAEHLHTDWLDSQRQRWSLWLTMRLPAVLLGMLLSILIIFIVGVYDPASLLQAALLGGFVGDLLIQQRETQTLGIKRRFPVLSSVLLGLLSAASFGLHLGSANAQADSFVPYSLSDWLYDGIISGFLLGLAGWLTQLLLPRISLPGVAPRLSQKARRFLSLTIQSVFLSLVLGAAFGLSIGLSPGLSHGLSLWPFKASSRELAEGLNFGFSAGVTGLFIKIILEPKSSTFRLAERLHWSTRHLFSFQHLLSSTFVALSFFLFLELSNHLAQGPDFAPSGGLSLGLGYWLFFGFYSGLVQNALEDQDRQAFNQGIRRSLRNGAIISCVTGLMIAAMIIGGNRIAYCLAVGNGRCAGASNSQPIPLGYSWLLFLCGMLIVWAWLGGLTVLRHFVIRFLLARFHTFPLRAQAFLDDATARILMRRVGGGYSLVHRRLLDHFADSHSSAGDKDGPSESRNLTPPSKSKNSVE